MRNITCNQKWTIKLFKWIMWIYFVITLLTSQTYGQAEYYVKYSYRVKHCENGNWYKCNIIRNRVCKYVNDPESPLFICKTGILQEEFKICSNFEESKEFCSGGYEFSTIIQSCGGSCNGNVEQIEYRCRSNPVCTKIIYRSCQCTGTTDAWTKWGKYSGCSKTCDGGIKERTRHRCFVRNTNEITTDCAAQPYKEKSTTQCNTYPCNAKDITTRPARSETTVTEVLNGKSFILPENDCNLICATSPYAKTSKLVEKCGATLDAGMCSSGEAKYTVTCDKLHICSSLEKSQCLAYEDWKNWTEWRPKGDVSLYRTRHRECKLAISKSREEGKECQKEIVVQTECKDSAFVEAESSTTGVIATTSSTNDWILPLVIALVCFILLICFCGTWFWCMRRKRKRRKKNDTKQTTTSRNGDDVFVTGNGNLAPSTANRLNVMHRIERVSEHLYEAISIRGSRLFSRNSNADNWSNSTGHDSQHKMSTKLSLPLKNKIENEYVSDEEGVNRSSGNIQSLDVSSNAPLMRRTDNSQTSVKDNVLRVSVMVTDPDGKEVMTDDDLREEASQSSTSLLQPNRINNGDYVSMNNEHTNAMVTTPTQRKKQWDRIPSPPSSASPSPKIFRKNMAGEKEKRQVGTFKAGLMNMLQNVRINPGENSQHIPRYDDVSPDMSTDDDLNGPSYIPSAPGSVCDNISVWSDSSFDSVNYSERDSPESPQEDPFQSNNSKRKKYRTKRKQERESKTHTNSNAPSTTLLPTVNNLKPNNLTQGAKISPNVEYLSPNSRRIASVQYLSPRLENPLNARKIPNNSGQSSPASENSGHLTPTLMPLSNEESNNTYLHMNKDRSTVKSWLNLGPAPDPNSDDLMYGPTPGRMDSVMSVNSYCTANEINQSQLEQMKRLRRQQSLDAKYTISSDDEQFQGSNNVGTSRPSMRDLPLDAGGYFNVDFPGPPAQRINTVEAKKAAKNVISAPLKPKHLK